MISSCAADSTHSISWKSCRQGTTSADSVGHTATTSHQHWLMVSAFKDIYTNIITVTIYCIKKTNKPWPITDTAGISAAVCYPISFSRYIRQEEMPWVIYNLWVILKLLFMWNYVNLDCKIYCSSVKICYLNSNLYHHHASYIIKCLMTKLFLGHCIYK